MSEPTAAGADGIRRQQPDAKAGGKAVNREMLILARGSRGLSQSELAEILNISQAKLSKYEHGPAIVSDSDLLRFAEHLDYPVELFCESGSAYGFASCCLYHRKRQSMPVRQLHALHDQINIMRIQLQRMLRSASMESPYTFPRFDIDEHDGDAEAVARLLRAHWHLPMGPVRNLVGAVENAGGIVVQFPFGTTKLDAVSQWPAGMHPLFFINKDISADRWRFTLAHEIGHIVMHTIPTKDAETEADRFASEFLMPEKTIASDLGNMSIAKAAQLKPKWRVSMQAIIRRAYSLKKITERQYRYLCMTINKLGYRKLEPVPIEPENPTIVKGIIDLHTQQLGLTIGDLSKLALCHEHEFRRNYLDDTGHQLRVVGQRPSGGQTPFGIRKDSP